ncbi:MAG: YcaQ family DNA glycosylase, partial [Solobacterium sp.]|nr:YcaQ family DNA glycosylase [Solobacterium sp.]
MKTITTQHARKFILLKQGLCGEYIFAKKQGALDYIIQAGCIQYDPIDVIGKNAELTLQSRVKNFQKKDLYNLLYKDRKLVDYFDKELSIIPVQDWPYFQRYRNLCQKNGNRFEGLGDISMQAKEYIQKHGPVSSASLPIEGSIQWHSSIHWSGNWNGKPVKASRSVLEQLYTAGELIIHHKEGTRKYYDLSERYIPKEILHAEDPFPDDFEHIKWRILRRIGAAGLLWNKNSTAFLGIWKLDPQMRNDAFHSLLAENKIIEVYVEGIASPFYLLSSDMELLEEAENKSTRNRCEFLAPLDPMLWDRNLIKKLFDFDYTWEIYVPAQKRKFGYYVLPILFNDRFIGRIEPVIENNILKVKGLWLEPGTRMTKKLEHAL